MKPLLRAAGVRAADAAAVAAGLPMYLLVEAAGRAAAERAAELAETAAELAAGPSGAAVLLCGRGNNGADGLAAARWLALEGREVAALVEPGPLGPAARLMRRALAAVGVRAEPATPARLARRLGGAAVVVDALFGTGFQPPLRPQAAALVAALNRARAARPDLRVLALDLPSGLNADSPLVAGEAVLADLTLAMSAPKPAHLFSPARERCGRIEVASAGLPVGLVTQHAAGELADPAELARLVPRRGRAAHKGIAGRVQVVGGLPRYPGAPALAAFGAFRVGAGLVTVVAPAGAGLGAPREATRLELGGWTPEALEVLAAEPADAVAAGMGMGSVPPEVASSLLGLGRPLVLDADLLQPWLARLLRARTAPVVLTPHPGEAGRMLGTPVSEVVADPLAAAGRLIERFPADAVVLKGGPTVVVSADRPERPWVNTTGNPGMATGGTGDVLGGAVAALIAQGLTAGAAARLGVYLHGRAGDLAHARDGVGLVAHDLARRLPAALLELTSGTPRGPG